MKKLIFLTTLLLCFTVKSQTLITWYNYDTKDLMFAYFDTIVPPCTVLEWRGEVVNACPTTVVYNNNYAKPKFDAVGHVWYNAATPQEQEFFEAKQEADAVPLDATMAINTRFITTKTDAQLDELYPQPAPFFLYCENIEDGTLYLKVSEGWRIIQTENNE